MDCFLLGEKAWSYLLDHYDSPLAQSGCTIFVKNVDALSQDQRRQLLAAMLDMDVCKRNRLLLSCVCQRDELSSPAGRAFAEQLGCLTLYLPPARHRCAQLSAIASVYLSHLNASLTAGQVTGMAPQAMALLQAYDWPHNYTQLQRVLQELALMAEGQEISVGEVEEVLRREQAMAEATGRTQKPAEPLDLSQTLDQINREVIRRVLAEEGGNQSRSAQRLGSFMYQQVNSWEDSSGPERCIRCPSKNCVVLQQLRIKSRNIECVDKITVDASKQIVVKWDIV